jgi:ABC-type multidrug transport system fused ATPase/permease subunit
MRSLYILNKILNNNEKIIFFFLILSSLIYGFFEIISISALLPLVNFFFTENFLISTNIKIFNVFNNLITGLNAEVILILVFSFFLFKNLYFIFNFFIQNLFSLKIRNSVSAQMFEEFLNLKLNHFRQKDHADFLRNFKEIVNLDAIINNYMIFFLEIITISLLFCYLLTIDYVSTIIILLAFIFISFVFFIITTKKIKSLSSSRLISEKNFYSIINETVSNFIEITIYSLKKKYLEKFYNQAKYIGITDLKINLLLQLPRLVFEIVFVLFICIVIQSFSLSNSTDKVIKLTAFILVGIRIMPSFSRILGCIQKIKIYNQSLKIFNFNILNKHKKKLITLNYDKNIKNKFQSLVFDKVAFKYTDVEIFNDLSFKIKREDIFGISGHNGSGKTTILHLITGLLNPDKGKIFFNRKLNLRSNVNRLYNISYLSQKPILLSDTLINNITLNRSVDKKILEKILIDTGVDRIAKNLKNGLNSFVGEGGNRLSVGMIQKISFARALAVNTDIIILDEITNNLDISTINKYYNLISKNKFKKTFIIVSHDKKFLKLCNKILYLK